MRKNICKATLFFIGLMALLLLLYVPLEGRIHPEDPIILREKENRVSVMFLGDSESTFTFIPAQLWKDYGIPSYNCATPAQQMFQTEDILRRVLPNQDLKVVILETNLLYRSHPMLDDVLPKVQKVFPVIRNHDTWKPEQLRSWPGPESEPYRSESKGYYCTYRIEPANTEDYMVYSQDREEIPRDNLHHFKDIMEICETYNVRLILVSTPSPKNWNNQKHNSVGALARAEGIPYLDLNLMQQEIPIDWQMDTYDGGDHLNYRGAEKVMDYMGAYLSDIQGLEDMRQSAAFTDWAESAALFYEQIEIIHELERENPDWVV